MRFFGSKPVEVGQGHTPAPPPQTLAEEASAAPTPGRDIRHSTTSTSTSTQPLPPTSDPLPISSDPPPDAPTSPKRSLFGLARKSTAAAPAQQKTNGSNGSYAHTGDTTGLGNNNDGPMPRPPRSRPPPIQQVAAVIGFSCAAPELDYAYILALCEHISLSSAASKEAARALRKEIKYGRAESQTNAVRLMGIMMRNSDLRFKEQIASKRFLAELSDVATSKNCDPAVRGMIERVLPPLAFEYQRDAELSSITTLWNKIKPVDAPINGLPLSPDDSLFTPTADPRLNTRSSRREQQRIPTEIEQLRKLRTEAKTAQGNARMLGDALGFTPPEELDSNEIVLEFHAHCLKSHEILSSSLDWAAVQASRSRPDAPPSSPTPTSPKLASNNPFAAIVSPPLVETEEESILAEMLSAHTDLIEVLSQYDSQRRSAHDAAELKAVQELSMNDIHFDRAKAGVPDRDGNYMPVEGGSSAPVAKTKRLSSSNPYANIVQDQRGYEVPQTFAEEPEDYLSDEPTPMAGPSTSSSGSRRQGTTDSEIYTPLAPSEKALGKLRRISMRTDSDPVEQQRALEEQLRQKYARNSPP